MGSTIVKIEHTHRHVADLEVMQLAVDSATLHHCEAALKTSQAWQMRDVAIECGDKQAIKDADELVAFCVAAQHLAWLDLQEAERILLRQNN